MVRIGSPPQPQVRFEDLEALVESLRGGAEQFSEAAATELVAHLLGAERAQATALKLLFATASALESSSPTAPDVWESVRRAARQHGLTPWVEREIARRSD